MAMVLGAVKKLIEKFRHVVFVHMLINQLIDFQYRAILAVIKASGPVKHNLVPETMQPDVIFYHPACGIVAPGKTGASKAYRDLGLVFVSHGGMFNQGSKVMNFRA